MSKEIYKDTYYKLTDEDKNEITRYFNKRNLKELIEFCSVIARVASYATWRDAEAYLKDVGEKKFFRDCGNCGHTFDCDPEFAINECGNRYEKWVSLTKEQEKRLKELKRKVNG